MGFSSLAAAARHAHRIDADDVRSPARRAPPRRPSALRRRLSTRMCSTATRRARRWARTCGRRPTSSSRSRPTSAGDPALLHHRADLDAGARPPMALLLFHRRRLWRFRRRLDRRDARRLVPRNERSAAARDGRAGSGATMPPQRGVPLLILRLAGIYGPGRSAFDKLREGTARRIVKPGQVFNRIHVDDIGRVTALAAAAQARRHLQPRRRRAGAAAGPRRPMPRPCMGVDAAARDRRSRPPR